MHRPVQAGHGPSNLTTSWFPSLQHQLNPKIPEHTPGKGLFAIRLLSEDPMWLVPSLAFQWRLIFHAKGSAASSESEPGGAGQQV